MIDPLPVRAFVGTAPQSEPDDFDRHVPVRSIDHDTRTASRPRCPGAIVRQPLEQRTGNIRPVLGRVGGWKHSDPTNNQPTEMVSHAGL